MFTNRSTKHLIAVASAALLFAGCSTQTHETDSSASKPASNGAASPSVTPVSGSTVSMPSTNSVHFAFDSSDLDASSRAVLDGYAAWLNANADTNITVEGNCDERGSREYNLALGQRRADSIRDYLTARGVTAARVDTVSFGEEKPVCTSSGEACWAQNRRGDIVTR